jgi:hypothetical protein
MGVSLCSSAISKTLSVCRFRGCFSSGHSERLLRSIVEDSDGKRFWFPDPFSWNSTSDSGTIHVKNSEYSSTWDVEIPADWKPGRYTTFVGLYENTQMPSYEQ